MRSVLAWIATGVAGLLTLGSIAAFAASADAAARAETALEGAERLLEGRRDVAEAERLLGESNLDDALRSARSANATAVQVGRITSRIASLLESTDDVASRVARSSKRGVSSTIYARRQTETAARVLSVISAYQDSAAAYSSTNLAALRRILHALRRTNASFPGAP
jgi:N-acetylglucosamine kinase-like BadF-type ATPase